MEFDATTFVLEIVNFLALLWLLTHFLYRPAQAALDARAQAAARQAADLAAQHAELDRRTRELAGEQAALQAQREQAQHALDAEIAALRQQKLTQLARELADEGTKARARIAQEQAAALARGQDQSRRQAADFVGHYLARLATPAVEASVIELFLADVAQQAGRVRQVLGTEPGAAAAIEVATAFGPAPELRGRVEAALAACAGGQPAFQWRRDPQLLAGIRVQTAGHRLEASLQRGVDAFAPEDGTA
jgi:F-type H+-transporting ATPase subunit b